MEASDVFTIARKLTVAMALLLVAGSIGMAQEPSAALTASDAKTLVNSIRGLEAEVQQLSSTLRAMQAEEARSRAETRDLREDLRQTRDQLASLKGSFDTARRAPANGAAVSNLSAQTPQPAGSSSATAERSEDLEERLRHLEEGQQLQGSQIADQYQTKVESGSKYRVRFSGAALLNIFANRGTTDNQDVPTLALAPRPLDTGGNFGATVRQSLLGLEVFGPEIAGARTRGQVQFDFFGGFPPNENGVTEGLVRMRVATLHFDWPNTSIVAGQDAPFFSPLSPTSLASLAYPALA